MRLIDADKFKENVLNGLYIYLQVNKEDIANAIDDEPTIETKTIADCIIAYGDGYETARRLSERPQGEWLSNGASTFGFNNPGKKCSLCGKVVEFSENFCPNCGANMKE